MSKSIREHAPFLINNTRVANYLYAEPDCAGQDIRVEVGGRGNPTSVYFKVDANPEPLALMVLDAVSSLYKSQIYSFSVRELICYMGGTSAKSIAPGRLEHIRSILMKLCQTSLSMCIDEEVHSRKLEEHFTPETVEYLVKTDGRLYMKGPLLTLTETRGGRYRIQQPPLLYEYARNMNNQILHIPPLLMRQIDGTRDTDRLLLIRYYLLRRIGFLHYRQRMHKATESIRLIWYSRENNKPGSDRGLWAHLSLAEKEVSDPDARRRSIHRNVLTLLEYFRSLGYIEDFDEITGERNVRVGVEIIGSIRDIQQPS